MRASDADERREDENPPVIRRARVHDRDRLRGDVSTAAESRVSHAISRSRERVGEKSRQTYELTVGPEDKERLKMVSEAVNETMRLCELDVTTFRIRLSGERRRVRA